MTGPRSSNAPHSAPYEPKFICMKSEAGGQPYLGRWLIGRVSHRPDVNEAIWQLFLHQP